MGRFSRYVGGRVRLSGEQGPEDLWLLKCGLSRKSEVEFPVEDSLFEENRDRRGLGFRLR